MHPISRPCFRGPRFPVRAGALRSSAQTHDPGTWPPIASAHSNPLISTITAVQQPPTYPPQQQPGSYAVPRPTNTLAIVSFASGIASYFVLPFIAGIAAIVTGHMARGQIKQSGEGGGGFALAGLILGYVNVVLAVLAVGIIVIVAVIIGAAAVQNGSH